MADGGANLNNISDNAYHSARRRMVASSYAPKNIEYWEPGVAASVIALKDVLDQRCARPKSQEMIQPEELNFDAVRWIYLFSMECLIKIVLSRDVFFVRNGTDHIYFKDKNGDSRAIQALQSTHAGQRAACTVIWDMDRFGFWQKVTNRLSKWYADNWQAGADFHTVMEALAIERMERHANGEYLYDLFQPMIEDVKGNEADMTMGDRIADVEQAVGAGTDGPAGSIIMTLFYLLRNPDTFHKLRTELDSVLSPTDAVAPWHKIKNLPYLHACIDESMRLSPPVATDLIRRTPPDRTTVIGGEVIPPSTNVSISAYTAHRDPIVFKDPEVFDPSRWMAKGTDQLREMLGIYIPFSAGVRGCIGRNVTILIQSVCIASLVYHYEFTLPHKDWEIELEEYFNAWPLKMPLKVWRRDEDSFVKA
ncbi:hypothetical protein TruAng_009739 [Truncatella angustata]|nr:hypothetical protein TruAng_009739 [Truncatella angustata]